jgi:cytosine/adenosine deaminase-related metal-dependent hydrolase
VVWLGYKQNERSIISTELVRSGTPAMDTALVRVFKIDPSLKNPTYDLSDLTVMPGWIDTHTHVATHFDRKTGRAERGKNETDQQS